MNKAIKTKRLRIESKMQKLREELTTLQKECQHTDKLKINRANTGNYDPHNDCYWTEFTCVDCGLKWSKNGSW